VNQQPILSLCTPADTPAVASIYNEYIQRGNATMDEQLKTADDIQQWLDHFNERECLYVLKRSETVIGWGIIKRYSEREGYRFACETAVYLTATEIGKGYGSFLKRFLIDRCRELEYHHLVAKIFATNTASIEYNRKLGYEIVGRQKKSALRMDNGWTLSLCSILLKSSKTSYAALLRY
jgi:L-amino acid N-acyltransferase YncA